MIFRKSVKVSREVEGGQSPAGNHIRRYGKAMDFREQAEMKDHRGEKNRKEGYPESQEGRTSKDTKVIYHQPVLYSPGRHHFYFMGGKMKFRDLNDSSKFIGLIGVKGKSRTEVFCL